MEVDISTHVPHKRYDCSIIIEDGYVKISTHVPHKRYDGEVDFADEFKDISTHVPHKRYDLFCKITESTLEYFNSRTSQEVRQHNPF